MQRVHTEAAIFGLYHLSGRGGGFFSDVEDYTKPRVEYCHFIENCTGNFVVLRPNTRVKILITRYLHHMILN